MKLKVNFMFIISGCLAALPVRAGAQTRPYFVTYDHHLEEPGALEIAVNPVYAKQRGAGDFLAGWTEFEYGVKGWWTMEFYLTGQTTRQDSTLFTGTRGRRSRTKSRPS